MECGVAVNFESLGNIYSAVECRRALNVDIALDNNLILESNLFAELGGVLNHDGAFAERLDGVDNDFGAGEILFEIDGVVFGADQPADIDCVGIEGAVEHDGAVEDNRPAEVCAVIND